MVRTSHVDNGSRVKRLLQIMFVLQESEALSSEYLAERFAVCQRTIFRDIQVLREAGIPIGAGENGKGYALLSNHLRFAQLQPLELIAVASVDAPAISSMRFIRQAREMAIAKMACVTESFSKPQVQFVLQRLAELQSKAEVLDEKTMELLLANWIKLAKKMSEKLPPQP